MTEKKKRQRVVAEITLAHLALLAREAGVTLSDAEAMAFLNENGRAYGLWKHMMHAGEEYVKDVLQQPAPAPARPLKALVHSRASA
jgi:hypothetical protein